MDPNRRAPTELDVLKGQGTGSHNHPGNRAMHDCLVQWYDYYERLGQIYLKTTVPCVCTMVPSLEESNPTVITIGAFMASLFRKVDNSRP